MFVRIVYHLQESSVEHLVECEAIFVTSRMIPGETSEGGVVEVPFLMIECQRTCQGMKDKEYSLPKDGSAEAYVMNNDGKTIDTYRF